MKLNSVKKSICIKSLPASPKTAEAKTK